LCVALRAHFAIDCVPRLAAAGLVTDFGDTESTLMPAMRVSPEAYWREAPTHAINIRGELEAVPLKSVDTMQYRVTAPVEGE
jgi:hypothetical protein